MLLATCIFAARSIRQASNRTVQALRQEAFGSNELAAAFAARTLESEIERYYQLTREEASRPEFVSQLKATLQRRRGSRGVDGDCRDEDTACHPRRPIRLAIN